MSNHDLERTRQRADESFIQLLTAEQFKLLHYIAKLLGNPNEAQNILQETNLVLWRKSHEFQPGTNFSTWAHSVAYWQVRAFVRDRQRDKHVFSEELVRQLASKDPSESVDTDIRIALRHCLSGVSAANLKMLRERYEEGASIQTLADRLGKNPSAVKVALLRIRRALLRCIERKMASC